MRGVHTAYYLVHSLGTRQDFEREDRQAAANFAAAARQAGVQRIIYLGGLGDAEHGLSPHLRSRQETGEVLRSSGVPVIELRASIIIGSGSLSFELIRALTERLPVMICPRWVATPTQPIAIEDVLEYLLAAINLPEEKSRIFEIGGPDVVSYGDIMREYARQRGLRRLMISVPLLTPYLSSLWLGLVTPVYARVGRKLVEGLRNPTVVRDPSARDAFSIRPRSLAEAIQPGGGERGPRFRRDPLVRRPFLRRPAAWLGRRAIRHADRRFADGRRLNCRPRWPLRPSNGSAGPTGWYYGNWLWKLRGWLDLLVGGVGLRRGRRDPVDLQVGDAVDFWRVEAIEPGRQAAAGRRNAAAGPGLAGVRGDARRPTAPSIRQTAIFDPVGLGGLAYWYALYPMHRLGLRQACCAGSSARRTSGSLPTPMPIVSRGE